MTVQDKNIVVDSDKKFAERLAQIGKFAEEKRVNTLQIIAGFMAGLEIGTKFNNQKVSLNND